MEQQSHIERGGHEISATLSSGWQFSGCFIIIQVVFSTKRGSHALLLPPPPLPSTPHTPRAPPFTGSSIHTHNLKKFLAGSYSFQLFSRASNITLPRRCKLCWNGSYPASSIPSINQVSDGNHSCLE